MHYSFPASSGPAAPRPTEAALIVEDMAEGARMMLAITQGLVESGRDVDITGFEREIDRLCAAILALPEPEGRALRPRLESLTAQIDLLHRLIENDVPLPPLCSG